MRTTLKAMAQSRPNTRTISSWWSNAEWKFDTMSELPSWIDRFMPGIDYRRSPKRRSTGDIATDISSRVRLRRSQSSYPLGRTCPTANADVLVVDIR